MKRVNNIRLIGLFLAVLFLGNCKKNEPAIVEEQGKVWRFAVVGDTHVTTNSDTIKEMIPYFLQDSIDLLLICGDLVEGGKMTTAAELEAEFVMWQAIFQPLYDKGIGIYPVRGNHEDDAANNIAVWNKIFSGNKVLPQNAPTGETNLTYSFNHKNAFFIGLDTYVNIHKINQTWLNEQLTANKQPHIFVFGHEAAFKVFHSDCLDDFSTERNAFWSSLTNAGVKTYFCGHDHFFDVTQIDDGDGNTQNDIYQYVVGGGGGWLMSKYNYNGVNAPYSIKGVYHQKAHGYVLVEISGETTNDLDVVLTWKERYEVENTVKYIATDKVIKY